MKISFDFDGVLAEDRMQNAAKKFIKGGNDVWITTTRLPNPDPTWNRDLFRVAKELGIPEGKIQMTNGENKWKFLKGFDIHFDDDQIEVDLIEENLPECSPILIYDM